VIINNWRVEWTLVTPVVDTRPQTPRLFNVSTLIQEAHPTKSEIKDRLVYTHTCLLNAHKGTE